MVVLEEILFAHLNLHHHLSVNCMSEDFITFIFELLSTRLAKVAISLLLRPSFHCHFFVKINCLPISASLRCRYLLDSYVDCPSQELAK